MKKVRKVIAKPAQPQILNVFLHPILFTMIIVNELLAIPK